MVDIVFGALIGGLVFFLIALLVLVFKAFKLPHHDGDLIVIIDNHDDSTYFMLELPPNTETKTLADKKYITLRVKKTQK